MTEQRKYLKSEKWQYVLNVITFSLMVGVFLFVFVSVKTIFDFVKNGNFEIFGKTTSKEVEKSAPVFGLSPDDIEARAAYVYDVKTGKEIFSKNGQAQLPLASLTKIMTAITALSVMPSYAVINIDKSFLTDGKDAELYANENWKFNDLLSLTLVESSNAGASSIASVAGAFMLGNNDYEAGLKNFISKMNENAKKLGLFQTYYLNGTGLDINTVIAGAYGSAKDMTKLMNYAVEQYPKVFEATKYDGLQVDSISNIKHDAKNTNKFVDKIPMLIGSKTGYTDLAGGNLAIVFDAGLDHPIAVAVLGSSEAGRFTDTEKLVWATVNYLNSNSKFQISNF